MRKVCNTDCSAAADATTQPGGNPTHTHLKITNGCGPLTPQAEHPGCPVCNRTITTYPKTRQLRPHNTDNRSGKPCRGSHRTRAVLIQEIEDQKRRDQAHAAQHWPHGTTVTAINPQTGQATPGAQITWDEQGNMALRLPRGVNGPAPDAADTPIPPTDLSNAELLSVYADGPPSLATRLLHAAIDITDRAGYPDIPTAIASDKTAFFEELADALTEQPTNSAAPHPLHELEQWWRATGENDLQMLIPKAATYSAHDIRLTGHVIADMVLSEQVSDAFASELACAVYLMSKVTRLLGAYKEGRLPTEDSITDARVYATMIARIRATGAWPGHMPETDSTGGGDWVVDDGPQD